MRNQPGWAARRVWGAIWGDQPPPLFTGSSLGMGGSGPAVTRRKSDLVMFGKGIANIMEETEKA
jgi:hypothetical protein